LANALSISDRFAFLQTRCNASLDNSNSVWEACQESQPEEPAREVSRAHSKTPNAALWTGIGRLLFSETPGLDYRRFHCLVWEVFSAKFNR